MIDTYLKYGFGGAALLFVALSFVLKTHRYAWWIAGACAAVAGMAAHYDSFWVMVLMGLGSVAALCCTTSTVDLPWRAKVGLVVATALGAFLCVWPTLEALSDGKIKCPAYVKSKIDFRLVAGLDLRGGLRLVYTVDVEEAIKDKRDRYYDEMRSELATAYGFKAADKNATREDVQKVMEKVSMDKPRGDAATILVKLKDPADGAKLQGGAFEKRFGTEMVRFPGQNPGEFTYKIRTDVETRIRETAVNQAKDTIGKRVDELGLREAAVTTRDEDIIIEVPGQDEATFREIREIVSKTARLEFKLLDDSTDFLKDAYAAAQSNPAGMPAGLSFFREQPPLGPGKTGNVTQAFMKKQPNETMKQTKTRFREWLGTLNPPTDHEFGLGIEHKTDEQGVTTEDGLRTYYLYSKAEITGDQIRDAQAQPDQGQRSSGGWYVGITFNEAGSVRFEEITGANVQKRFAIILDDTVESAPRILSKIGGGHASITMGSGDVSKQLEDSRKLELVLRSGALPAPITPSNEQRIGASLGSDSIKQGIYGALAGGGLVLLFMLVYYHVAGLVADVAVIFNLFLQLAILATFGAAMTLPGIAGLALTMGMAVDANVLINERIREELRAGKSPRTAVDTGYDKAFSAIIDGHMTTFIAGLILAQYGSGPIKGFAVTLLVGMVASLFTSVLCTRLAFDWWVRGRKVKTLDLG